MREKTREQIKLLLKRILIIEIILLIFPFIFTTFSITTGLFSPDLLFVMYMILLTPFILMISGVVFMFFYKSPSEKLYRIALGWLCFDFDKKRDNTPNKYWIPAYFVISGLYFFIFGVFFYFAGFTEIGMLIFLCWFGLMFLRLIHFLPGSYNICRSFGKLLFTTLMPFGILLEIGLIYFKKVTILWDQMAVFIFISLMMILSTLASEILIVGIRDIIKAIRKK